MAKNRELSWHKARQCWRKKYSGRTYYLGTGGKCKGERDKQGYDRALVEWLGIKAKLDKETPPYVSPAKLLETVPASSDHSAELSTYDHLSADMPLATIAPQDLTLADVIREYLQTKRKRVEKGERSAGCWREARDKLADFLTVALKYKKEKIADIDMHFLRLYRDVTIDLPPVRLSDGKSGHKISPFTAKKRLAAVRMFMEWSYRNGFIDHLPRNIDRYFVEMRLPDPDPKSFTVDEVQELFKYASQRTKLYIALALNCGYGQTDIATLQHAQIFWDEGAILRERNKTGSPQHHKLWKITLDLLRAEMTDNRDSDLVLLDVTGKPLQVENMDAVTSKTDPIGRSFDRARKRADYHREKLGIEKRWNGNRKGIKYLRKTGAQTLAKQFPETPHIVKQYLGHKEKDVVRHYRNQDYALLFKALEWAEDHFALKATIKTAEATTEAVGV